MLSGIKLVFSVKMLGLSVCLAFAFVVSAFVIHEFTYDNFHKANDRIFRMGSKVEIASSATNYAVSPLLLADGIMEEIPEAENACRIMFTGRPVFTIEDKGFTTEVTLAASTDFLKIFSFDFISGSKEGLEEPNKIILTESTASKFFGEADPLQKTINLPWTQLEVVAVIKYIPSNSHLKFDALIFGTLTTFMMDGII